MRLHTERDDVERSGVLSESQFTIKTTAKAFDILSSGLYTDPITAIIRELSCNAFDAHVEAGKRDEPFEIHLPTHLEPFFSVKDNGIGLSDEEIQGELVPMLEEDGEGDLVPILDDDDLPIYQRTGGLYTTYFDSTKTESNDFIGALGLGSKSPFSYTNAFQVISRYKGTKRTYSVFLNEDGIPSIAKLSEVNTDEPSGLEVILAVKKNDFWDFKSKTASILRYFPVKPKVLGERHFKFQSLPDESIKGDDWIISKSEWTKQFIAVQGYVPYRVDLDKLKDDLSDAEISFLKSVHLTGFFEIGDLEVAASREEIRYDKRSKQALIDLSKSVKRKMTKQIESETSQLDECYWNACVALNKTSLKLLGGRRSLHTLIDSSAITKPNLKRYVEQKGSVTLDKTFHYEVVLYDSMIDNNGRPRSIRKYRLNGNFEPQKSTSVFFNDVKVGGLSRIAKSNLYSKPQRHNSSLVIKQYKDVDKQKLKDKLEDKYETPEEEYKRILEQLGHPPIKVVSTDTPKLERAPRPKLAFYKFAGVKRRGYASSAVRWDKEEAVLGDKGIFFRLDHGRSVSTRTKKYIHWTPYAVEQNLQRLVDLFNSHHGTKYKIDDLCGVSTLNYEKIAKLDGWTDIFDFAFSLIPSYEDACIFQIRYSKTESFLGLTRQISKPLRDTLLKSMRGLNKTSTFRRATLPLFEEYDKHKELLNDVPMIIDLDKVHEGGTLNERLKKVKPFYESDDFKKYPMLTFVGSSLNETTEIKKVFDYIKLVDRRTK